MTESPSGGEVLSPREETTLCTQLEQVVDQQLVEEMFLNSEWLVELEHGLQSDKQRKKTRKKSTGASKVESSVDYLCSSDIGKVLHGAVTKCPTFTGSGVFQLAISKLFCACRLALRISQGIVAISKCSYQSCASVCLFLLFEPLHIILQSVSHEYDDHDQEPEVCGLSAESHTH